MRQHINSRFDFVQYCLRALGAPVIRINITEEQIDDRVNDALDMFLQFHMDGCYREVYVHTITQEDIDNKKIMLPNNILSVIQVYLQTDTGGSSASSTGDLQMTAYFSDLIAQTYNGTGSISSYTVTQSYLGTMNASLPSGLKRVSSYRVYENELTVNNFKWSSMRVGQLIGLDCYQFDEPDEVGRVFNDYWLKQYATALIRRQWGQNLTKFTNIALPGGGTLNGEAILVQAQQEITDLEQRLKDQFSLPILPFMA